MTLRPFLVAFAACGLMMAGVAAAEAQELQAGQMMTQAESDRLDALQADLDREEAEYEDNERRDRRRPARDRQNDLDAAEELLAEMDASANSEILQRQRAAIMEMDDFATAQWEAEDAEREAGDARSVCLARLPAAQKALIVRIRQQYRLMERQLREDEPNGPNLAEAIAGLHRGRDMAIDAMTAHACG